MGAGQVALMIIYVYASGSDFENTMNAYMSGSTAIDPHDGISAVAGGNSTNSTM